jgi:hypothetical protein
MSASIWIALDVAALTGIAIYIVHELFQEGDSP